MEFGVTTGNTGPTPYLVYDNHSKQGINDELMDIVIDLSSSTMIYVKISISNCFMKSVVRLYDQ